MSINIPIKTGALKLFSLLLIILYIILVLGINWVHWEAHTFNMINNIIDVNKRMNFDFKTGYIHNINFNFLSLHFLYIVI